MDDEKVHDGDAEAQVEDPVCGMQFAPERAAGQFEHEGRTYYFCNPGCLEKFRTEPAKYLETTNAVFPTPPAGNGPYTCPMDPEVVQDSPGACPICGMALEPQSISLEEGENPEFAIMKRRFRISLLLTAPILIVAMGEMLSGSIFKGSIWLQLILATPVVLWGGWPFFQRGWASVINRSLNMFTLIAVGTGAAYAYSVFAALFPNLLPESFRGHHGTRPGVF